MRGLALPFFYLVLIGVTVAVPISAASILLDIAMPGAIAVADAEPAATMGDASAQPAVAEKAVAKPHTPVWIVPTRQYNYTPPPLVKVEPAATERAAPAKKEKAKEATKRQRKPPQEARQLRATPEALQAFAAEITPERPINRD